MEPNCIRAVDDLQQESEAFCDLTGEQLLYACITGIGLETTKYLLDNEDWSKCCPNVANED